MTRKIEFYILLFKFESEAYTGFIVKEFLRKFKKWLISIPLLYTKLSDVADNQYIYSISGYRYRK